MSELRSYIRDKKGNPIGIIVAIDRLKIGWALCHKNDKWDKDVALKIARNRANDWNRDDERINKNRQFPESIKDQILKMAGRSGKYFKDIANESTAEEFGNKMVDIINKYNSGIQTETVNNRS